MKKFIVAIMTLAMMVAILAGGTISAQAETVLFSVDVEIPDGSTFGYIAISNTGAEFVVADPLNTSYPDYQNNSDGIVIAFWQAGANLRIGVREAFDPAGNYYGGLQARVDIPFESSFSVKLTKSDSNKFMFYVNETPANDINWNTSFDPKTTDNLLNATNYEGFDGWDVHDGVIPYFNNVSIPVKVTYLDSGVVYTNEVIYTPAQPTQGENGTTDPTTAAPTTAPGGDTQAPGDNTNLFYFSFAIIALAGIALTVKKVKTFDKL